MKSLKEFVQENDAALFRRSDVQIIQSYLSQPEMLEKAPEIIVSILQNEINRYARLRDNQLVWGTMSFDYYYDEFPKPIASKLVNLTLKRIAEVDFSESDLEWLKNNVPHLKLKTSFYQPLLQSINYAGFRFKGQSDEEVNRNISDYKRGHGIM